MTTSHKKIDQSFFRILSNTILSGWITRIGNTKERLVSDEEMRTFLRLTNDEIRENTLFSLSFHLKSDNQTERFPYRDVEYFLVNVWPRQKSIKSESISAELIRIAAVDKKNFGKFIKIILPLLTPINDDKLLPPTIAIKVLAGT